MKNKIIPSDLTARFDGTVIKWNNTPYYVRVGGDCNFHLHTLDNTSRRVNTVSAYDEGIDVSTPRLGYVWLEDLCVVVWLARKPTRRYTQGINRNNLVMNFLPDHKRAEDEPMMNADRALLSKYYLKAFNNDFPTVTEAIKILRARNGRQGEVAVSHEIALLINSLGIINVYLSNDLVGYILPHKKTVKVPSSHGAWVVSTMLEGLDWEID